MKSLTLICALVLGWTSSHGQSAVAFCSLTTVYSYCYNDDNPGQCARNICLEKGGKVPNVIYSTARDGYGAIALGTDSDGRTIIGAGCGYDDAQGAKNMALSECRHRGGQDVHIVETWFDGE